ncbi:MAG TPA: neuraminidase-like domain-containing protein, partial [Blastocatellia bacterium]|nr:neuraminidase-like domain-containing protein [Blastocatellia bacterium]
MAILTVNIDTPQANAHVDDVVTVNGSVSLDSGVFLQINFASVSFGDNGPVVDANVFGANWQCSGSVPRDAPAGAPLRITVFANVAFLPFPNRPDEPDSIMGDNSVIVILNSSPPELTIDPFNPDVTVGPSGIFRLHLSGTARDSGSGISIVRIHARDPQPITADNPNGNWFPWSKDIDLPPGEYTITVDAFDTHNAVTSKQASISVKEPFEPTDIDQAFATTTYLRELLAFAKRQIKIGTTGTGPSAEVLAARFFQPFDRLITSAAFEQAVLPVNRARIAVEVLRRALNQAVPAEIDQRFRGAAYEALMLELGTSHEELRLARVADAATRRALAARIGIEIADPRPDHLDQMTIQPDLINAAQLETLFGYRSTSAADPLQPPAAGATFLGWRLAALRNTWLLDDVATRDSNGDARPIIDPDVIDKINIASQQPTSPAFALWTARKAWIDSTLGDIQRDAGSQTTLAQFDLIVAKYAGPINLAALAARDANGEDVTNDIRQFHLDLDAFRFLALCRGLLAAGTLLQSEWQDVFSILLQARKQTQFVLWRSQEKTADVILEPNQFLPTPIGQTQQVPRWRGSAQTYSAWRRTLVARTAQKQTIQDAYAAGVDAAESQTLPGLRDALVALIGQRHSPPEDLNAAADRLSRELLIDLRANARLETTRVDQALETLQGILFSVRSGRLSTGADGVWKIPQEQNFDLEWDWMGSYRTWLAAIRVFAYPENQLFPNLYLPDGFLLHPTKAFLSLINSLRNAFKVTPEDARIMAAKYLSDLRAEVSLPPDLVANASPPFFITDQLSDSDLMSRQQLVTKLIGLNKDPNNISQPVREVFWLVPIAVAMRLQQERHYLAALDWFQSVYAFNLSPANRKIYGGLVLEESVTSAYVRVPEWLTNQINPHIIVRTSSAPSGSGLIGRKNVCTRFTVMSIVRCFLDYADLEFSRNLPESIARARGLYETAADLLSLPDVSPETGQNIPFPPNPIWSSLLIHVQSNLAKIHNGLNIAGVRSESAPNGSVVMFLPSQYRYSVLAERAKNLVGIAQQVESSFLSAMEQRDAATYTEFQANHDIQVARSQITLADLKVADADISQQVAELQVERAQVQFDHYDHLIKDGLNGWEIATLAAEGAAVVFRAAAATSSFLTIKPDGSDVFGFKDKVSSLADLASATAQFTQTKASFNRREEEWLLQKHLSDKDRQIGEQQVLHAQNQQQVALQERQLTGLQLDHAQAVLDYLATKFTNAELFDWMSGVLGRVYAYFLQQATSIAQLAQAQLAFERQETSPGFIASDYWQDTSEINGSGASVDRRGLTGSARLLEDITRLDQYAFDTDRRKLHLTQTLSLSEIAAFELQQFRETGLLVFSTPTEMFDREFPGHYLR